MISRSQMKPLQKIQILPESGQFGNHRWKIPASCVGFRRTQMLSVAWGNELVAAWTTCPHTAHFWAEDPYGSGAPSLAAPSEGGRLSHGCSYKLGMPCSCSFVGKHKLIQGEHFVKMQTKSCNFITTLCNWLTVLALSAYGICTAGGPTWLDALSNMYAVFLVLPPDIILAEGSQMGVITAFGSIHLTRPLRSILQFGYWNEN